MAEPTPDRVPEEIAEAAGLRYVTDEMPGLRRRRRGAGWSYQTDDGTLVRDEGERARIASLAIPPAWSEVWICPDPRGHLQATGRDDRGRKQYRYHPLWVEARDEVKFQRLLVFGRALPRIRAGVDEALGTRGLNRERVLAAVVALMERSGVRVGNDEYARENETYGLTTIRRRHVRVEGSHIRLRFEAKGGREVELSVRDRRLAPIVAACAAAPGYEVFKWIDPAGGRHDVKAEDVNGFIRGLSRSDLSAKDFRTWLGTVEAFCRLCECEASGDGRGEEQCLAALDAVAERLRNTREVARDAYVHPLVLERFTDGGLGRFLPRRTPATRRNGLSQEERGLLALLEEDGARGGG